MNNLENVFKLIDAGYTKEEINALMSPAEETATSDEPTATEVIENKEPETKSLLEADTFKELSETIKSLNDRISKLDKSIKSGNILTDSMHAGNTETAEDILASLITPKLTK